MEPRGGAARRSERAQRGTRGARRYILKNAPPDRGARRPTIRTKHLFDWPPGHGRGRAAAAGAPHSTHTRGLNGKRGPGERNAWARGHAIGLGKMLSRRPTARVPARRTASGPAPARRAEARSRSVIAARWRSGPHRRARPGSRPHPQDAPSRRRRAREKASWSSGRGSSGGGRVTMRVTPARAPDGRLAPPRTARRAATASPRCHIRYRWARVPGRWPSFQCVSRSGVFNEADTRAEMCPHAGAGDALGRVPGRAQAGA